MNPITLRFSRFLNLVHRWLIAEIETQRTEQMIEARQKLKMEITGSLSTPRGYVQRERVRPPWWWQGDDDAATSSLDALNFLRSGG